MMCVQPCACPGKLPLVCHLFPRACEGYLDNSCGKLAVSSREAGCYSPQPLRSSSSLVSESREQIAASSSSPRHTLRRAQPSVKEPHSRRGLGLLRRQAAPGMRLLEPGSCRGLLQR